MRRGFLLGYIGLGLTALTMAGCAELVADYQKTTSTKTIQQVDKEEKDKELAEGIRRCSELGKIYNPLLKICEDVAKKDNEKEKDDQRSASSSSSGSVP